MMLRGAISQLVSRVIPPGRAPSRWPRPDVIRIDGGYRSTWTDEGRRLWQRDVAAFLASCHSESREPEAGSAAGEAWAKPKLLVGEREVLGIYASHWLVEMHDRSDRGYRLLNLVSHGRCLVWELPGYNQRDAERLAVAFVDGYV
jgi:hypothetical protein